MMEYVLFVSDNFAKAESISKADEIRSKSRNQIKGFKFKNGIPTLANRKRSKASDTALPCKNGFSL